MPSWRVDIFVVTKSRKSLCQKSILLVVISVSGLHPASRRLMVFRQPRWGGQAALNSALACNNAIKVMRYTRQFWFEVPVCLASSELAHLIAGVTCLVF